MPSRLYGEMGRVSSDAVWRVAGMAVNYYEGINKYTT